MFRSEWLSHMVAKASSLSFIILLNIQRNNNNRRSIQGELGMRLAERAMRGHVSASSAQLHWCKKGKGSDVTFKLKAVNIFVEFPSAPKITMAKHWTTQQVLINKSQWTTSATHLCSCGAPRGQRGPSQRWKPREKGPQSCASAAASSPSSRLLKVFDGLLWSKRATFSSGLSPQEWDGEAGGRHSASLGGRRLDDWAAGGGVCVCRLQESGWMLSGVAGRLLWADGSQDWCSSLDWTCRCSRHTSIREGGDRQRRTHPPTVILQLLSFPPVSTPPPTPPFILERGESLLRS